MGTPTHSPEFDAATDAELQRLEDDAAAAAYRPEPRMRLMISTFESQYTPGSWSLIVTYTDDAGNEDKTTRVGLSVSEVARTIAQELDNA